MHSDNYGTVYGIIKSKVQDEIEAKANYLELITGPERYKVVIEAHADEIAFIITYIDKDGLVYVTKNGGSDAAIAPSKKVVIHTRKNGRISGVFGFPAIHVRSTTEDKAALKP